MTLDRSAKLQALRDAVVIGVNQFTPGVITLIGDLRYRDNHYRVTKDVAVVQVDRSVALPVAEAREAIRTELAEHALKEADATG